MKRRALVVGAVALLGVALLVLLVAPEAQAAGGGGSAGFGGGGGGGEGGGGGGGAGLYIIIQILIRIAILGHGLGALVLIGLFLLYAAWRFLGPRMGGFWSAKEDSGRASRRVVAKRERRVELAAAEAAEDDPAFAPDAVEGRGGRPFPGRRGGLGYPRPAEASEARGPGPAARVDPTAGRFPAPWLAQPGPADRAPNVEYVSLVHRGEPGSDRVVVRIEARIRDYVVDRHGNHLKRTGHATETVRLREYWTLLRNGAGAERPWILGSIEQGAEGRHALQDQIVATPWSDEQKMRDESLVEGAVAQAVPKGTKISEVADLQFEGEARAAANDLSLADGRFAPDILEVAVRRAVQAWAEAIDGDDAPLAAVAAPDAVQRLLHPGDPSGQTRVVVRGPNVKQIRIAGLDAAASPPTMTVEVDVEGRRYIEDRDTTAVVSGSRSRQVSFTVRWTFALTDDQSQPWRISAVGGEPARI